MKVKVNWTIDADVLQSIRTWASKISKETNVKISESAAANSMLKQQIKVQEGESPDERT